MRIAYLRLENFMGVVSGEYRFSPEKTIVSGMNGSGKTTLMDAHLWLWSDYNSGLKSNPPIRPLDGRECIVKVTEEILLEDGTTVQVAKIQKEKRSKPDENGETRVTGITNSYEINAVGKTDRDFKKEMAERGVDLENFLVLSHPELFTSQKAADMRKVLFGMTKSHTDREIAEMTAGCGEVAELLGKYKLDEITAMQKATKRDAEKRLKEIPQQIIGMNKARVEVDAENLEAKKAEIVGRIESLKSEIPEAKVDDKIHEVMQTIAKHKMDLSGIEAEANVEIAQMRSLKLQAINNMTVVHSQLVNKVQAERFKLEDLKSSGRRAVADRNDIRNRIKLMEIEPTPDFGIAAIEAETFDGGSLTCPTCGRPFSAEQQSTIRRTWEAKHQSAIADAKRKKAKYDDEAEAKRKAEMLEIEDLSKKIEDLTNEVNAQIEVVDAAEAEVDAKQKELEKAQAEYAAMPMGVDISGNREYQEKQRAIAECEKQLAELQGSRQAAIAKANQVEVEIYTLNCQLNSIEEQLASVKFNADIDEKIAELEYQQRREGQNQADAERILAQIDAVSKKRNEMVTEEINSHFKVVRFRLFDYQKNGEYKETCIPEVKDGETWKQIGMSANTALSTIGKLDIVDGLQRFYGQRFPIFVDYAAELDEKSVEKIQSEMQLIFLVVNNSPLEVKGVA